MTRRDVLAVCGLVAFLAASAAVINPFFEHPVYDDWAYAKNVLRFLEDGRLYFVWTQTSFVFQFLVGVLFCKVLGFSFATLHLSTLTFALLGALALYAVMRQAGHAVGTSFALAMSMTTTVFYFHFMFSFMTDIPSVATALGAVAAEWRAQKTRSTLWYGVSAAAFTVAILTRDLIGVAVIGLFVQAWWRRELRGARLSLLMPLLVWAGYLVFGPELISMPWRQMKAAPVYGISRAQLFSSVLLGYVIVAQLAFQFSPLLLALVPQAVRRVRRLSSSWALVAAVVILPAGLAWLQYRHPTEADDRLMPYRPGFLSVYGIYNRAPLPGDREQLIGTGPRMTMTAVAVVSCSVLLLACVCVVRDSVRWLAVTPKARRILWLTGAALAVGGLVSQLQPWGLLQLEQPQLPRVVSEQTRWVLRWSSILALVGSALALLTTVAAYAMARRPTMEEYRSPLGTTPTWPVYLYAVASLLYYVVSAKFFVRYALVLVPGLYILLRHGLGPLKPTRSVLIPLMILSLATGIVWTEEHIRFNTARWQAGRWLLNRNVPPDWIEGGFEFDGWHLPFGEPPRSELHKPSPHAPQVSVLPRFLITLDTFAPPGRGRRTYDGRRYRWLALFPYNSMLHGRTRNIVAWGDTSLSLPLPPRE